MTGSSLTPGDADSNVEPTPALGGDQNHGRQKKSRGRRKSANEPVKQTPLEPTPELPPPPVSGDPFDPANLSSMRLSQDFAAMAAVKPVITSVAVRKPGKHEFVRVRAGTEWQFQTGVFIEKSGLSNEIYLVVPALMSAMLGNVTPTLLVLAMSRQSSVPFLWPLVLASPGGKPCLWHETAIEAAQLAESKWLKVVSDTIAGLYVPHVAAGNLSEPIWPGDLALNDYLRLAFKGRLIDSINHPCLQRMRGEI